MLIWDTGEYEVLPYCVDQAGPETESSGSECSGSLGRSADGRGESEKLRDGFRNVCRCFLGYEAG